MQHVGVSGFRSLISRLCGFCLAADGFRACAVKHAIEDLAADGNCGLLGTEGACPQSVSDDRLVAADRSFDQRPLAVAGGRLPLHPPLGPDRGDVPVALVVDVCVRASDRVGARENDDGSTGAVPADGIVGRVAVIGAIGRELANRSVDLIEQRLDL